MKKQCLKEEPKETSVSASRPKETKAFTQSDVPYVNKRVWYSYLHGRASTRWKHQEPMKGDIDEERMRWSSTKNLWRARADWKLIKRFEAS